MYIYKVIHIARYFDTTVTGWNFGRKMAAAAREVSVSCSTCVCVAEAEKHASLWFGRVDNDRGEAYISDYLSIW